MQKNIKKLKHVFEFKNSPNIFVGGIFFDRGQYQLLRLI